MFSLRQRSLLLFGIVAIVFVVSPVSAQEEGDQQPLAGSYTQKKNGNPFTTTSSQGNVYDVGIDIIELPGPLVGFYNRHWVRPVGGGEKTYLTNASITFYYPLAPGMNTYSLVTVFQGQTSTGTVLWDAAGGHWDAYISGSPNLWEYHPE